MEAAGGVVHVDGLFAAFLTLAEVIALQTVLLVAHPLEVYLVFRIGHEYRRRDDALPRSDLGDDVVVAVHDVPF